MGNRANSIHVWFFWVHGLFCVNTRTKKINVQEIRMAFDAGSVSVIVNQKNALQKGKNQTKKKTTVKDQRACNFYANE